MTYTFTEAVLVAVGANRLPHGAPLYLVGKRNPRDKVMSRDLLRTARVYKTPSLSQ
jgi:hypothetical protein